MGRAKRNPRSLLREKTRSYSLVGECDADGYRIAARRAEDSRGGSRYMWSLAPGARREKRGAGAGCVFPLTFTNA